MKRALTLCLALASAAMAQEEGMKFEWMDVNRAPEIVVKGKEWRMSGGVDLVLYTENSEQKPVAIKAEEVYFVRPEEGTPEFVELKRNVVVDSDIGKVSADQGILNVAKNLIGFTGNVVLRSEEIKQWKMSEFQIDLETGDFSAKNSVLEGVRMMASDQEKAPADPMLLTTGDVKDWAGLVAAVQTQAKAEAASPGKHIVSLLSAEARELLMGLAQDAEPGDRIKKGVVKELNAALQRDDFYNAAAWEGVQPGEKTAALLKKGPADTAERIRLNRGLLESAYPALIAKEAGD